MDEQIEQDVNQTLALIDADQQRREELLESFVTAEQWFVGQIATLANGVTQLTGLTDKLSTLPAAQVGRSYARVKDIDEALDDVAKALGAVKSRLQYTVVPEAFDRDGMSTFTTDDGVRITLSSTVRASVKDKENGYQWLRDHELGDLITETVNASTLSAAAKKMLEENLELPEEFFSVAVMPNTSVTKVKAKK